MRLLAPALVLVTLAACGPAHLRSLGPGGERDLPDLVLGGWDGRRLRFFDDTTIEPGTTSRRELTEVVSHLDGDRYAVVWFESARLDADAQARGVFCGTAMCVVVFERKGGGTLAEWGPVAAVFELTGAKSDVVGTAWLAGDSIRPPGPSRWPLRCLDVKDEPRYVHPDGGALYPDRVGPAASYALFDRARVPEGYRQAAALAGFQAPSEKTCDEDKARFIDEPAPPRPIIEADPQLLGEEAP